MIPDPLMTSCPAPGCVNWQVDCLGDAARKARLEQLHRERLHPRATTEAVTSLVAADPRHETERREIEETILVAARRNGGRVSANDVRPLLPSYVQPSLIGAVFSVLSRDGGPLVKVDRTRSTDLQSRNTHHDHNVYVLREYAATFGETA